MDNEVFRCYNIKERGFNMFNIEEELKKLPSKPRCIYNEK
jgi:hypothetical protein